MRVLIVDDSPTALSVLRIKLEKLGYDVLEAKNGREAWDVLQERHVPLVITDWMMPEVDGITLCKKIRAGGTVPYTYVVLLTVKDLRKDRIQGLEAGADDFLMKPVDPVELNICLQTARRILGAQDAAARAAAAAAQPSRTA